MSVHEFLYNHISNDIKYDIGH